MWPEKFSDFYTVGDLASPHFQVKMKSDFVTSFEIAQHLQAAAADNFVSTLTAHDPQLVFFGAATPNQDQGLNSLHVNEATFEYWIARFAAHGYRLDWSKTLNVRHNLCFKHGKQMMATWWYPKNILVFARAETLVQIDRDLLASYKTVDLAVPFGDAADAAAAGGVAAAVHFATIWRRDWTLFGEMFSQAVTDAKTRRETMLVDDEGKYEESDDDDGDHQIDKTPLVDVESDDGAQVTSGPDTTTATTACASPIAAWFQCGGVGWPGSTCCVTGYYCKQESQAFHRCVVAESGGKEIDWEKARKEFESHASQDHDSTGAKDGVYPETEVPATLKDDDSRYSVRHAEVKATTVTPEVKPGRNEPRNRLHSKSKSIPTPPKDGFKVYVYQEEVFHHRVELERCDPGGLDSMTTNSNLGLTNAFLKYLATTSDRNNTHQLVVTDNPDEADWFYVPFDADRSYGAHVRECGQNHLVRLTSVLDALERSLHYQRYRGADHVWCLGGWELTAAGIGVLPYFPFRRELIHNMALLRYADQRVHLSGTQPRDDDAEFRPSGSKFNPFKILTDTRIKPAWWRQGQDHRCTVNIPSRSLPAIGKHHATIANHQSLEEWEQARPYKFHFVGVGDYPYSTGQQEGVHRLLAVWGKMVKQLPPSMVFHTPDRIPPDEFAESLAKSQFCLMIRGDDPCRSRFADALSAGCIPVIISDGFFTYCGSGRMIHNYDAFTIRIPESVWLVDGLAWLMWAVTMPRAELRFMHASMMDARPKLVYDVDDGNCPEGDGSNKNCGNQAIEYIFQALNERCKLDESELNGYLSNANAKTIAKQARSHANKIDGGVHNHATASEGSSSSSSSSTSPAPATLHGTKSSFPDKAKEKDKKEKKKKKKGEKGTKKKKKKKKKGDAPASGLDLDQIAGSLSEEEVQRQDDLFDQSAVFPAIGMGNGNNGPAINFESTEALVRAAVLAKWHHLRRQTYPDRARKYLEVTLQIFHLNSLTFTSSEKPNSDIQSTIASVQDMYDELDLTPKRRAGGSSMPSTSETRSCDGSSQTEIERDGKCSKNSNANAIDIDWTDPIFLRAGWTNDPVVVESHKLLFFPVYKTASSEFMKLLRRMMGHEEWATATKSKLNPNADIHDPWTNGLRYLGQYSRDEQEEMMTSGDWTRAIFVRDPLERLVSAYKDKALRPTDKRTSPPRNPGHYLMERCCGMNPSNPDGILSSPHCAPLRPYNSTTTEDSFPFPYFVEHFMPNCVEAHWSSQAKRMHPRNWQFINFVGSFDRLKGDTHALLKRIGAFDAFGSRGWGKHDGAIFEHNLSDKVTGAKQSWEQSYVSPYLHRFALEHYILDYEHPIMNFTKPKFSDTNTNRPRR